MKKGVKTADQIIADRNNMLQKTKPNVNTQGDGKNGKNSNKGNQKIDQTKNYNPRIESSKPLYGC